MARSRRNFLIGSGVVVATGLAGCAGGDGNDGGGDGDSGGSTSGDGGEGGSETFQVGHGDYQTSVDAANFPEKLYVYAVQSGWSNWPALMEAFENKHAVALNDDDRSSGEALKHLRAHAQNPDHSAYNGGYTYGILANQDGLLTDYKPANWDTVPSKLKSDDGVMTATRRMTTAVTYRKDIYEERGLDAPETWDDLLHPDITKDMALQTPTAAVGLACALSVNNARGGSMDDLQPVVDYYKQIKDGGAEFTDNFLAQFTKGEYSTFVRYDYSGLNLKYNNEDLGEEKVDVALLQGTNGNAGAFNQPYGYGMVKGAPNPGAVKLFMDYVLSTEGQKQFLDAYVRPIRAPELDMPDEFPSQDVYGKTEFQVDYGSLVEKQEDVIAEINKQANL
jgi:putative spermidine/putrescine transport system substrate-binding protein